MDLLSWLAWAAAGTAVGLAAGLVPGLHVNVLLPSLLAAALDAPALAAFLPALATAHAFTSILPATYVGVPDPDGAVLPLPAHNLLHDGRGPLAVRIAAHATLAAIVAAIVLIWPAKWVLDEPGRLSDAATASLPWVLGALCAWMLWVGRRKPAANGLTFLLAGLLGVVALQFQPAGLLGPVTPLGPALAGLFGGAGLLDAIFGASPIPEQKDGPLPSPLRRAAGRSALFGSAVAALLVPVSAATPAVAATLVPTRSPERAIAALAAVGAAHQTLAMALLWVTQRPRTGLAAALLGAAQAQPWPWGTPPPLLLGALLAILVSALLAHPATLLLGRTVPRALARFPPRAAPAAALAVLVVLQAATAGWQGLLLFAAATAVGLVPLATGARRLQLVAALVVPSFLRSLG